MISINNQKWLIKLSHKLDDLKIANQPALKTRPANLNELVKWQKQSLSQGKLINLSPIYLAKLLVSGVDFDKIDFLFNQIAELKMHYQKQTKLKNQQHYFEAITNLYQQTNYKSYYPINALIDQIQLIFDPLQKNQAQIKSQKQATLLTH